MSGVCDSGDVGWLLTIGTLALGILATQAKPTALAASHQARAVAPGEVVVVDVRAATPLQDLAAQWLGRKVTFYRLTPERWQGLAAIDLDAAPGLKTLDLRATTADGRALTRAYALTIARRVFATRRISVAAEFAEPPPEALARIEQERKRVEAIFASPSADRLWKDSFVVPVPGTATSSFGRRTILNGQPRGAHTGTDFQAASGTPVVAPNAGRVVLVADLYFAGRTIIIDHGLGLYSYLAHLSEFDVAEGTLVTRGQKIALSGATGRVTGPHLHWSMRVGPSRVDPLSLVDALERENGKGTREK